MDLHITKIYQNIENAQKFNWTVKKANSFLSSYIVIKRIVNCHNNESHLMS